MICGNPFRVEQSSGSMAIRSPESPRRRSTASIGMACRATGWEVGGISGRMRQLGRGSGRKVLCLVKRDGVWTGRARSRWLIAELECTEGWVDLIDVGTWFAILERAARILEGLDLLPDQASDFASAVLHERDYTVIELTLDILRREGVTADAVRCAFIEGIPVTEDSAIYDKTHVQIAVRNPAIILNHSSMDRRNLDIRR